MWLPVVLCTKDGNVASRRTLYTSDEKCGFPLYFVLRMEMWLPVVLCTTDGNVASRRTSYFG